MSVSHEHASTLSEFLLKNQITRVKQKYQQIVTTASLAVGMEWQQVDGEVGRWLSPAQKYFRAAVVEVASSPPSTPVAMVGGDTPDGNAITGSGKGSYSVQRLPDGVFA